MGKGFYSPLVDAPIGRLGIDMSRRELFAKMSKDNLDVLEQLTQPFFGYEDDLNELNMEYVRKNRAFF